MTQSTNIIPICFALAKALIIYRLMLFLIDDVAGNSAMSSEGSQLLSLADKQMICLGQGGIALVLQLSCVWYRSALPNMNTANSYRYWRSPYQLLHKG